ncbi:GNAT family N-acetyltransferase [Mesorhizobium neociceri]|uniref:GNAT family N-acetyltransferase n=1 Tax=Mesorhizobium neociceri TaxID=1307853 RepID=A0A838AZK9_9HYPH|nr:GNAT family N-acetyltransferase [Mesorhizobium neociceri]MBA1138720.1 GNAT family N-acetyltransferase [Mesorhizobium neociceri]
MGAKTPPKSGPRRKPTRPTPKPKATRFKPASTFVQADQVVLVPTKGNAKRGGGPGGEAWRIEADGKRAGVVFINFIDEAPVGQHASIQIYLNTTSQGRRIGRVAYRKACEASRYDVIYAHMRKGNDASRRAAEEAGFKDDTRPSMTQLLLVWRRN